MHPNILGSITEPSDPKTGKVCPKYQVWVGTLGCPGASVTKAPTLLEAENGMF